MTIKTITYLILLPCIAFSQTFQQEINTIPVTQNGRQLQVAWNGGFNTLSIAMPDIDNDGDRDLLLTGRDDGSLQFYRNEGNGANGIFVLVNPSLSDLEFGPNDNRIAFDDIDFDGDLDLFVGENDGRIKFFKNEGDATNPDFMFVTDFLDSIDVGFVSSPTFADLNADGLNDLLIGGFREGFFYYTRNDSITTEFTFVDTLRDSTGTILKPGFQFYEAALVDIDADGDLDLFGGSNENRLAFFVNSGSASAPQFDLADENFIVPPRFISFITPSFVDIDNDLDYDLFFGSNHGFVTFYRNQGDSLVPNFVLENEQLQLDFLDVGLLSFPTLVDIDADTDLDLFIGTTEGRFNFLRNTGSAQNPVFEWVTERFLNSFERTVYPAWGDLDGDGDFDLIIGQDDPPNLYYKNNGSPQLAQLDSVGAVLDTLGQIVQGVRPELGDIDGDSDLDLFVIMFDGSNPNFIASYENVGTPDSAAFVDIPDTLRDESGEIIARSDMHFRLADLDSDGDLDLFLGRAGGTVAHYENVGSPTEPSFRQVTESFAGISTGNNARSSPFLVDIDADDDMDVFTGRFMGGLFFHRNVTVPVSASLEPGLVPSEFALEQNYPNPFNPFTTIRYRLPKRAQVKLTIFDVLGQTVRTLVQKELDAGVHSVIWDGRNKAGLQLTSGLYFYRLEADGFQKFAKMLFVK